jgi:hypothetical protein
LKVLRASKELLGILALLDRKELKDLLDQLDLKESKVFRE